MTLDEACEQVVQYRKLAKASEAMVEALLPDDVMSEIRYNQRRALEYFKQEKLNESARG